MRFTIISAATFLAVALPAAADERTARPKDVPATRDEVKKALDDLKKRTARLPLPPMTEQEKERAKQQNGGRPLVNNGRMRQLYLGSEFSGGFFGGDGDEMSLDATYKVMFFWIVSRVNNCHYCLGHQEGRLASSGVSEERIAALDGDWGIFKEAQREAFAFTRKLTFEPHRVGPADLARLRKHYSDKQILEIVLAVAGFNATNRWTDGMGIPQEEHRVFLKPTPEKYRTMTSKVAPLCEGKTGPAAVAERPSLESRDEVEKALAACRQRTPLLPLVDEAKARALLPKDWPNGELPQWVRLLANFPKAGIGRARGLRTAEEKGKLDKRLKASIHWIAARHDRAWYALGHAMQRLHALGVRDDDIFALDGSWEKFSPGEQKAFALARKLTIDPARIADNDVVGLRKYYSDKQVAEIVHQITNAAFFDRLTEVAILCLEDR